ncbi:hypothetical protein [Algisphaera agarilytica]|uniref:ActR/RegA family two-component response regulator n=1 Tax=Algisphaera agarilytica TaxID=1385975 RepID=A0A7X0H4D3_9BACT|nr:hypothetical protein [Algisphaera agarilytica]MBB6429056.1 ActR/RegA family two-component response regulator [Algisphaera agarilytica]
MNPTTQLTHVALVGHCGFDSSSLTRLAKSALPDAKIVAVNSQSALDEVAHAQSLLLINRVLDGRFDAGSSLAMIQQLAQRDDSPAMMLVSNYPDAQAEAEAAGALPGFGKSDLGKPETAQRLRNAGG